MRFLTIIGNVRQLIELIDFVDFLNGSFRSRVQAGTLTANHVATLPNKTGTFAFLDDLTTLRNEVGMIGSAFTNTSTANAAAVITISAPGAGLCLQLNQLTFSYSGAPTNGLLTIQQGSTVIHETAITAAGAGPLVGGYKLGANTAMTITLAAGGSGVVGRVSASVSTVPA